MTENNVLDFNLEYRKLISEFVNLNSKKAWFNIRPKENYHEIAYDCYYFKITPIKIEGFYYINIYVTSSETDDFLWELTTCNANSAWDYIQKNCDFFYEMK